MLFERDKKLNQALEKALAMKKQGKSNAEIIKLFPNCQSELESLLETAAVVEKGRDNILPDENVLRKILARMDQVTADDAARYSFTEESSEANFIGNLLSNFNQAFMSKKVYVGAVAAVFLLAIIVGVGWYNFSRSPEEISLATLENGVDELDAEFAYLTELSNDPFADLDGDLQMISGLTNGKTEGAEESTPAVATDSTTSSLDTNFKNMESEFSKFESDLKSLNSLGEGKSLDGIDDTLSAIDDVL